MVLAPKLLGFGLRLGTGLRRIDRRVKLGAVRAELWIGHEGAVQQSARGLGQSAEAKTALEPIDDAALRLVALLSQRRAPVHHPARFQIAPHLILAHAQLLRPLLHLRIALRVPFLQPALEVGLVLRSFALLIHLLQVGILP